MEYLHSLKQPDGSFLMHVGGEVDVRWVRAAWGGCFGGPGHFEEPVLGVDAMVGSWCHSGDSVLGAGDVFGSQYCFGDLVLWWGATANLGDSFGESVLFWGASAGSWCCSEKPVPWQGAVLGTQLCFRELAVVWGVGVRELVPHWSTSAGEVVPWWGASAMGRCSFGEPMLFWVLVPWQGGPVTGATAMAGCRCGELAGSGTLCHFGEPV